MNRIQFPRTGYDGKVYSQTDIEDWYWNMVESFDISTQLAAITTTNDDEKLLLRYLCSYLKQIVLAPAEELQKLSGKLVSRFYGVLLKMINGRITATAFNNDILAAFDYKSKRLTVLTELASKLNIKSCPYCNSHYTLYVEEKMPRSVKKLAKFQFDHFFPKRENPFLSMSLYNLVPSCAVCNQAKSTSPMDLKYHPYYADIHTLFKFRVDNPVDLWSGASGVDNIEIKLIPTNPSDNVDEFEGLFKLEKQYGRHKDVVKEVYEKVYVEGYYANPRNFSFMGSSSHAFRLLLGTYVDCCDIERRPLTKFIQDIWEQAHETP